MITNLFLHVDGGYVCLLIEEAQYHRDDEGCDPIPGVVYMSPEGVIRALSREQWERQFTQVRVDDAAVAAMPEDVQSMIRRANPGDHDLDFIRVFESWAESEINLTGSMLELAVGATAVHLTDIPPPGASELHITIKTEDLQHVLQNYEIEKVPEPHGFTFKIRKSFPEKS